MAMTTTAMPGFVPMALPPGLPQEAYGQGNTAEWLESWYAAWTMMSHGMRLQASPGGSDDPLRESSSGSLSEGEAGEPTKDLEPHKVLSTYCGAGKKKTKLPAGEPVKKMPPTWAH
mmetsp:Transcript_107789/g.304930  ORF Transcript_107789/g.304930 Transcript_107789/m.304930 type:complete len:116 (+) Transcript_107789:117-464(+)